MTDPITREQVERLRAAAQDEGRAVLLDEALPDWHARGPEYVREAWRRPGWSDFRAALTIDDSSPERLRERREALGWTLGQASDAVSKFPSLLTGRPVPWRLNDVMITESERAAEYAQCRAHYAAALSAEEERRGAQLLADEEARAAAFHAKPERPPAPEVVDVPQPEPWHARLVRLAQEAHAMSKACAEADDAFKVADAERERTRLARNAAREACHAARKALTEATTARAILDAQQPARDRMPPGEPKLLDAEPTRPEPRFKVGDWVRVQHHGTVYQIGEVADPFGLGTLYFREKPGPGCTGQSWAAVALTPALDPALHETARKTVAILRKSTYERLPDGASKLPMFREWNNGPVSTREWAAQLEHLLGDAP